MHVVICGGGVIGTSTAFFLAERGVAVTLVERTALGCAASGKSGGFLALDWCQGQPVDGLARRSFALHAELADRLGNRWGYRRIDTLGVVASERRDVAQWRRRDAPDWLSAQAAVHAELGTEATTAQIDPEAFTVAMMDAASSRGAALRIAEVTGLEIVGGAVRGVRLGDETVAADAVVVAMGPWSILASRWLPLPAVWGLKGNSIVYRYRPAEPRALFVECEGADGTVDSPEVMPRPDGTTYVCGLSGEAPLPVDPAAVMADEGARERLIAMTRTVSPDLAGADVLRVGACYRPVTEDGMPLIGPVPGVAGAYVATGHSVWGMLNAPATGEALAELLTDGATTLDLAALDPARLPAFEGVSRR